MTEKLGTESKKDYNNSSASDISSSISQHAVFNRTPRTPRTPRSSTGSSVTDVTDTSTVKYHNRQSAAEYNTKTESRATEDEDEFLSELDHNERTPPEITDYLNIIKSDKLNSKTDLPTLKDLQFKTETLFVKDSLNQIQDRRAPETRTETSSWAHTAIQQMLTDRLSTINSLMPEAKIRETIISQGKTKTKCINCFITILLFLIFIFISVNIIFKKNLSTFNAVMVTISCIFLIYIIILVLGKKSLFRK